VLFLVAALTLTGCDLFGSAEEETVVTTGAVVANSGNFSAQDGSLTIYNPNDTTAARNDLNVAYIQSISIRDGRLYVVDNTQSDGSGRITVYDGRSLDRVAQIANFPGVDLAPVQLGFVSDQKAYATNLSRFGPAPDFAPRPSTVSILDLETNTATDTVAVGPSPRGVAVTDGRAFVANQADSSLTIIDTGSDTPEETVQVPCAAPDEVFVDGEGEVAVVCKGSGNDDAQVLFLDPGSLQVLETVALNGNIGSANATQAAFYSPMEEELYAISGGNFRQTGSREVFRVDTDANALATTLQVPQNPSLTRMTAVGYDAVDRQLYVTRLPVGGEGGPLFDANGTALVLDREGTVIDRFEVGNSPGYIGFLRETR
jgi:YVTN family beta-propeller protein